MQLARLLRHLLTPQWRVARVFPRRSLARIEAAIAQAESRHRGQIRFAVEHALDLGSYLRHKTAAERAIEVFSALRVWDTEHNNGVLIYLLLADRHVEIVADRGAHAKVGRQGWEPICRNMEAAFRAGRFEPGVIDGIAEVARHLQTHFPRHAAGPNELPDRPVVL